MASRPLIAWVVLCAMATVAAARPAPPFSYLVTDSTGQCYARCTPGMPGTTRIFRVHTDKDELVDEYPWYERSHPNRLYLLAVGFDTRRGKPVVAVFRPHNQRNAGGPDKQPEFSIYLAGKLVSSYTTKDLKELGAEVKTITGSRRPDGDYAVYRFNGYDGYQPAKHPYGCLSFTVGDNVVLVDIATGNVIENPYPQSSEEKRESSNRELKASLDHFKLIVTRRGGPLERNPGDMLTLMVNEARGVRQAQISRAEAETIIDYLAEAGHLANARDVTQHHKILYPPGRRKVPEPGVAYKLRGIHLWLMYPGYRPELPRHEPQNGLAIRASASGPDSQWGEWNGGPVFIRGGGETEKDWPDWARDLRRALEISSAMNGAEPPEQTDTDVGAGRNSRDLEASNGEKSAETKGPSRLIYYRWDGTSPGAGFSITGLSAFDVDLENRRVRKLRRHARPPQPMLPYAEKQILALIEQEEWEPLSKEDYATIKSAVLAWLRTRPPKVYCRLGILGHEDGQAESIITFFGDAKQTTRIDLSPGRPDEPPRPPPQCDALIEAVMPRPKGPQPAATEVQPNTPENRKAVGDELEAPFSKQPPAHSDGVPVEPGVTTKSAARATQLKAGAKEFWLFLHHGAYETDPHRSVILYGPKSLAGQSRFFPAGGDGNDSIAAVWSCSVTCVSSPNKVNAPCDSSP